jgi:type IV secretion system protein VirD4
MVGLHALTWLAAHWWHIYAAMGGVFVVIAILHVRRRRRVSQSVSHGSARWATPREIRQAGLLATEGVMLGRSARH